MLPVGLSGLKKSLMMSRVYLYGWSHSALLCFGGAVRS